MQIRQILFIELLGGIGDLVIALPAIHALARTHPAARLTVLTFAPAAELLQTDPLVQQIVIAPNGQARQAVAQILQSDQFDLIVSDTNYDQIADLITNHQRQTAHSPVAITNLWRSPPDDQRVGDRFLRILCSEGVITQDYADAQAQLHLTASEYREAQQALGAAYRPLVVFCPDAGMAIKRWPLANFVALGNALLQQYEATILILVGSEPGAAEGLATELRANNISEKSGEAVRVWPRSSLRQVAAVIAQADLIIAADTGLAQIAAALNVPTITLFGPSWHARYGQLPPHINLQGFSACPERKISNFTEQRCWYSGHCPYEWRTCLEDIMPDQVMKAARPLLEQQLISSASSSTESSTESSTKSLTEPDLSFQFVNHSAWQAVRNLLVMRLDNIGDVIMTSPALYALRQALPTAKLTLMASPGGALTAPLLPWVDAVLPWRVLWQDLGRLAFDPEREWELIHTLQRHQFDAVIIFTSFSQSPHPAALVAALAGIPLRLGESKEQDSWLTHAVTAAPDAIHQVDRNLRLIASVGFEIPDRRLKLSIPHQATQTARQLVQSLDSSPLEAISSSAQFPPYLLLNPWTSCQSRNYETERFALAARELSRQTGWPVVVTGVEKDRPQVPSLLTQLGSSGLDLVGATSLAELAALIAQARLVLTNNTSTMHIADATNTPSVILFAGTELESQWKPRYSLNRVLRYSTVCSPCYQFQCPYQLQCLDIPPETVITAGLELLQPVDLEYMSLS